MNKVVSAAALLVIFLTAQTQAASFEPVFNTPGFKGMKTTTIEDKVIELISLSTPGSSIHLSMYSFGRMTIALELLRASARGVDVNMVFDGALKKDKSIPETPAYVLINGAGSLPAIQCKSPPCIKFCGGALGINSSCRGTVNNHNKFIIFSNLNDGRSSIVAVSSANWTDSQLRQANDLLIVAGDELLYRGALAYWMSLKNSKLPVPQFVKGSSADLYVFPNQKNDPVLDNLNKVSCQAPGSKIRIMQSRLTDDRIAIARRLMQLSAQGCDVKVVARHEPSMRSPGPKMVSVLKDKLLVLPYETAGNEDSNSNHAKIVIIDAPMNGSSARVPLVMAGSHNLNKNSLKNNDELLFRVVDRSTFDAYNAFWEKVVSDSGLGY